jgi:hypothetical protein
MGKLPDYPNMAAWIERMHARPGVEEGAGKERAVQAGGVGRGCGSALVQTALDPHLTHRLNQGGRAQDPG